MMNMKQNIIQKLTSRKFWMAVVGFVTAVITVFNIDTITPEQVKILVMAFATLVAYILGEGLVDAVSVKTQADPIDTEIEGVGEDA
jgi:hypothetical protein